MVKKDKINSVLIRGRDSRLILTKMEIGFVLNVSMNYRGMTTLAFSQVLQDYEVKELKKLLK